MRCRMRVRDDNCDVHVVLHLNDFCHELLHVDRLSSVNHVRDFIVHVLNHADLHQCEFVDIYGLLCPYILVHLNGDE